MKSSTKIIGSCAALLCLLVYVSFVADLPPFGNHKTWAHYAGSPDQSKFFNGSQITKQNVNQLQVAFVYPTEDAGANQFSPIVVDDVMYLTGKSNSLIAINATTGKEIWIHTGLNGITRRGLNYWESKDRKDRRLIFTLNNTIQAIDAQTGKSITTFGNNGYTDMREGLDREVTSIRRMQSMMPGVIYDNLLILGSAPGEGYFSPPGHIRAYNVVTGKREWTFHTIPHPGEFGYDTWPKEAYKYVGGVNVWGEISVDVKRGIAYLPIGSPTYDYYGGDRLGANLFGNSLVALDARTGKRLWHFQTIHHDLWDYDLTSAPQLITVTRAGKKIDAVAVATKHGLMFVFDRVTGKPVFPIVEKPFPKSEMPGEQAWPTQPMPSLPHFVRHEINEKNLNPLFEGAERAKWLERISKAKTGLYVPPSDKYETIMVPGALAGANYGNSASDPDKGIVYLIAHEWPSVYKLERVKPPVELMNADDREKAQTLYATTCKGCHGENMQGAGIAPSLVNVGQRVSFEDFKKVLEVGKGQMPGFAHVEETRVKAIYSYLGGNPNARAFGGPGGFGRGGAQAKPITGPVVANGGATVKPDEKPTPAMSDYPVAHANKDRYLTDYGTTWSNMLNPVWSRVLAYDLNKGIIKWDKPLGVSALAESKGLKNTGAPEGGAKKGLIVTSTGIVFATGKGGKLYAYDAANGNVIWETNLSWEPNAQPIMYEVNGKQYLAVSATANFARENTDRSKDPGALPRGYVVYSLPDKK